MNRTILRLWISDYQTHTL